MHFKKNQAARVSNLSSLQVSFLWSFGNDSTPEIADKLPTAKKNLPWWIFSVIRFVVTICSSALLPSETLSPQWVPAWATPPYRSSLLSFRAFEKRKDKTNLKHPFLLISPVPFLVWGKVKHPQGGFQVSLGSPKVPKTNLHTFSARFRPSLAHFSKSQKCQGALDRTAHTLLRVLWPSVTFQHLSNHFQTDCSQKCKYHPPKKKAAFAAVALGVVVVVVVVVAAVASCGGASCLCSC